MPVKVLMHVSQPTQQLNDQILEFDIPDASAPSGSSPGTPGTLNPAQAASLAQANQFSAVSLFISPSGSDTANTGLSAGSPFATLEAAYNFAGMHGGNYTVFAAAGTYNLTQGDFFSSNPYGSQAVPIAIVGTLVSQLGTLTASANSANGSTLTVASNPGGLIRQSTTASIVAGAPAGQVRILVTNYTAADIGKAIRISGSANSGTNHWGQICKVNPGTSIDVQIRTAVSPDVGPLTVTDSYEGAVIVCLSGANTGQKRLLRSNTTTTFGVNVLFTSAISINDTFTVNWAGSIFNFSQLTGFFGTAVGMKFCKFVLNAPALSGAAMEFSGTQAGIVGCEWDLNGTDFANGALNANVLATIFSGNLSTVTGRTWKNDTTGLWPASEQGCGSFIHNGVVTGTGQGINAVAPGAGISSRINGFFVLRSSGVGANEQCSINLNSPDCDNVTARASNCSELSMAGTAAYPAIWNGQYTNSAGSGILNYSLNSVGTITAIGLSNSGGDAILALTGSRLACDTVTGTGNAGVGLHPDRGSYIQIDSAGANHTTVTGTTGDIALGHQTIPGANIQTYAAARTADGNGVKGVQDTYGNRVEP